jgi:hypothetical protein
VAVVVAALHGCSSQPGQPSDESGSKPGTPVLKLSIRESVVTVSMPNALSKSSGGNTEGFENKAQFEVVRSTPDGGRTFLLRGTHAHFGTSEKVPADRRGSFTVTADSDSSIPVSFQIDCPVPVKVVLDGNEVSVPAELTPGRHQLSVSGRFQPKP